MFGNLVVGLVYLVLAFLYGCEAKAAVKRSDRNLCIAFSVAYAMLAMIHIIEAFIG